MRNVDFAPEHIELSLPSNAAYVSAARLTASSIANRLNFHIDEIEDIKAAVSEACTLIIQRSSTEMRNIFKIVFSPEPTVIKITISTSLTISMDYIEDDISLTMIKALMDEMTAETGEDGRLLITMVKQHRENSF